MRDSRASLLRPSSSSSSSSCASAPASRPIEGSTSPLADRVLWGRGASVVRKTKKKALRRQLMRLQKRFLQLVDSETEAESDLAPPSAYATPAPDALLEEDEEAVARKRDCGTQPSLLALASAPAPARAAHPSGASSAPSVAQRSRRARRPADGVASETDTSGATTTPPPQPLPLKEFASHPVTTSRTYSLVAAPCAADALSRGVDFDVPSRRHQSASPGASTTSPVVSCLHPPRSALAFSSGLALDTARSPIDGNAAEPTTPLHSSYAEEYHPRTEHLCQFWEAICDLEKRIQAIECEELMDREFSDSHIRLVSRSISAQKKETKTSPARLPAMASVSAQTSCTLLPDLERRIINNPRREERWCLLDVLAPKHSAAVASTSTVAPEKGQLSACRPPVPAPSSLLTEESEDACGADQEASKRPAQASRDASRQRPREHLAASSREPAAHRPPSARELRFLAEQVVRRRREEDGFCSLAREVEEALRARLQRDLKVAGANGELPHKGAAARSCVESKKESSTQSPSPRTINVKRRRKIFEKFPHIPSIAHNDKPLSTVLPTPTDASDVTVKEQLLQRRQWRLDRLCSLSADLEREVSLLRAPPGQRRPRSAHLRHPPAQGRGDGGSHP